LAGKPRANLHNKFLFIQEMEMFLFTKHRPCLSSHGKEHMCIQIFTLLCPLLKIMRTFAKYYTIHKQQKQNETLCIINIPASIGGLRNRAEGVLHIG
jgi:hypothetical protein